MLTGSLTGCFLGLTMKLKLMLPKSYVFSILQRGGPGRPSKSRSGPSSGVQFCFAPVRT